MPNTSPPDPLDTMQTAMQNADKANLRLFLAMDYAVSMDLFKHSLIPTEVLNALDHARECAAAMFVYLTAPVENAAEAGPTEDHLKQEYLNGLLTVGEYDRLVNAPRQ